MCTQQRAGIPWAGPLTDQDPAHRRRGIVPWFGWWTRQFLGLIGPWRWDSSPAVLGYHVSRVHRRDTEDLGPLLRYPHHAGRKTGGTYRDVFGNLPDFSDLTRRDSGIKANYKGTPYGSDGTSPKTGSPALGQWAAFVKTIRNRKRTGAYDLRNLTGNAGSRRKPAALRSRAIDHRALARLASASGYTSPIPSSRPRGEQNPAGLHGCSMCWCAGRYLLRGHPALYGEVSGCIHGITSSRRGSCSPRRMGIYMRIRNRLLGSVAGRKPPLRYLHLPPGGS